LSCWHRPSACLQTRPVSRTSYITGRCRNVGVFCCVRAGPDWIEPSILVSSTFAASETFLGNPEEKPSMLPRRPINRNEAPSQFYSNSFLRFSLSSFICFFMASTLELASLANTLPNLKKRVAVKVQLSPFGSIMNGPLGQTIDVGNVNLYSIFLFGSTSMQRDFILCTLPCKYSST